MHLSRKALAIVILWWAALLGGCMQAEPIVIIQTRVTTPTPLLWPQPTATMWIVTATPEPATPPIASATTPMPVVRMGFPADPASTDEHAAMQWLLAASLGNLAHVDVQPLAIESGEMMVEALCTGDLDLAWLATPVYLIARERCGAEALFRGIRNGSSWHRGQILVRDAATRQSVGQGPIISLAGLEGLTMAYTQRESTTGHYLPQLMLSQANVAPGTALYTGGDRQAVLMLYRGEVDAAATYWLPLREDGSLGDARALLADTLPDVGERLQILTLTPAIPNDPLVCRGDLPDALRQSLEAGLARLSRSADGRQILGTLYGLDGLEPAADADYDGVREMGTLLEIDWQALVQ